MCREVFKKFRACINVKNVNAHRADRDAIDIVYKSLQQDRKQADIRDIIRKLHEVVDEAIEVRPERMSDESETYDISHIDFELLKREFQRYPNKHSLVQDLKHVLEKRVHRLLAQNPLRADFQKHYEETVATYNREKDRVTIEQTFEALLKLAQELDNEGRRAVRESLDEESLAIFDLLKKPDLNAAEIKRIKDVAVELLRTLKAEKLRVDQWREKETTRDAVVIAIRDFLYNETTGLPTGVYSDDEVAIKSDNVFRHVFHVYPTVPSPYYQSGQWHDGRAKRRAHFRLVALVGPATRMKGTSSCVTPTAATSLYSVARSRLSLPVHPRMRSSAVTSRWPASAVATIRRSAGSA